MNPSSTHRVAAVLALALAFGHPAARASADADECVDFESGSITIAAADGGYLLSASGVELLRYRDRGGAERALAVMRHYGMDRMCSIGGQPPRMMHFLAAGAAPSGAMPGEDCLPFDRRYLEAAYLQGAWRILDARHWMLEFGDSRGQAEQALETIRGHGFDRMCFVGRPNAPMIYFRADPSGSAADPG